MKVVSFKIDEELLERFDRVIVSRGLSRSRVIRELIKAYLESCDAEFNTYTSEFLNLKLLVLDERKYGVKQLPQLNTNYLNKVRSSDPQKYAELIDEYNRKLAEVCREIQKMKYEESKAWSEIAGLYGVTRKYIIEFYRKKCMKMR